MGDASYPVHWNKWVFYTEKNTLKIYVNRSVNTLQLGDDLGCRFQPVITPPYLYLIPHNCTGGVLRLNILSLTELVEAGALTRDVIEPTRHVITGSKIYPACWFQPEKSSQTGRIALWCHDSLKLLDVDADTLTEIYQSDGLLNDHTYAPCFDSEGALWLMDNDMQILLRFIIQSGETPLEERFEIRGRGSAPVADDESVYYYLNSDGATTNLIKHPRTIVADNINCPMNRISDVQHTSPAREDHPHYQVERRVTGVQFDDMDLSAFRNLVQPVWVDINGLNAMIIMHN